MNANSSGYAQGSLAKYCQAEENILYKKINSNQFYIDKANPYEDLSLHIRDNFMVKKKNKRIEYTVIGDKVVIRCNNDGEILCDKKIIKNELKKM